MPLYLAQTHYRRRWMSKKLLTMAVALPVALCLALVGCADKSVRHLASDAVLITPDKTTKKGVLAYLGPPDQQIEMADGGESWLYYQVKKDALSKTPYIGEKFGEQHYETVKVVFEGDLVRTCFYRQLTEEEFEEGRPVN